MNPYIVFVAAVGTGYAAALALPHVLKQPSARVEDMLLVALFPVFLWVWWALRPRAEAPEEQEARKP